MRLYLLILCLPLMGIAVAGADRPHVLWVTSEDMGPHLGCYGDEYAMTPNLDALASRGMIYVNATSTSPVCAPARTAIISGLFPASTGAEHMRSQVQLPDDFRMLPQFLREAGYYCTNNSKEDYNVAKPGRVWDESNGRAHWKHRRPKQPFFAVFNHTITHESQIRNAIRDGDRIHDPAKVRVPAYHPDVPEVRRDWAQYYDRITMMDARAGAILRELEKAGLADDTIVFYYSDHGSGMPRNKRWLYMSGLRVPMIVYFPPRWRHLAPKEYAPGSRSQRLVSFVDLAPTILSLAGIRPPEWMQGTAFAGMFEGPAPEYAYGMRGRMDERYDLMRSVRDQRYNYIRNYMPHRIYGQHMWYMFETRTTVAWKRLYDEGNLSPLQAKFWQPKLAEELYDLQSDADEVHNLAGSTEHRHVLLRMREAHAQWAKRVRDVGLLSEWEMHGRSRGTTPYELGHDDRLFDFDAVFAAADLATSLDPQDLPKIVRLLDHSDSGVRFWAANGVLAHGEVGLRLAREEVNAALEDESPMVQIVAAEILGRFGSTQEAEAALEVLVRYVQPESKYLLAVAAWNALDELDERALPVLDELRELSTTWPDVPGRMNGYPARLKEKTLADLE